MGDTQESMPRPQSENTSQIVIRVPDEWVKRADALVGWIARPGVAATRTDVFRAAMATGLDALEAEAKPARGAKKK